MKSEMSTILGVANSWRQTKRSTPLMIRGSPPTLGLSDYYEQSGFTTVMLVQKNRSRHLPDAYPPSFFPWSLIYQSVYTVATNMIVLSIFTSFYTNCDDYQHALSLMKKTRWKCVLQNKNFAKISINFPDEKRGDKIMKLLCTLNTAVLMVDLWFSTWTTWPRATWQNRAWEKKTRWYMYPVSLQWDWENNKCISLSEGKHCGQKIAGNNTTNMKRHIRVHHKEIKVS